MPSGGDGTYYFSTYILLQPGEFGHFNMRLSDDVICSTNPDHGSNGDNDYAPASCSAVVDVVAGKIYFRFIIKFKIFLILWN